MSARGICTECGYRRLYDTTAKARYGLARHSCDKQRALEESWERTAQREATIDRTPKTCTHDGLHAHGTYAMYVLDRCRCPACQKARHDYDVARDRANRFGTPLTVPADPVRAHIATLQASGIGLKQVARLAGVSHSALGKLVYGHPRPDGTRRPPTQRVRQATATKILAINPEPFQLAPRTNVDATGTRRRLQALATLGWSPAALASELDIDHQRLRAAMTATHVHAATAAEITHAYDRLWNTPPFPTSKHQAAGITRTRNRASAAGWAPPLAWDDDQIDNPAATPHRGTRGARRNLVENIAWYLEMEPGTTTAGLALRFHMTGNGIEVALRRAGRQDILDRLARNRRAAS